MSSYLQRIFVNFKMIVSKLVHVIEARTESSGQVLDNGGGMFSTCLAP